MAHTKRLRKLGHMRMWIILTGVLFAVLLLLVAGYLFMIRMPGRSYQGALPPLSAQNTATAAQLRRDIGELAEKIGRRSTAFPAGLERARDYIRGRFAQQGYAVRGQEFLADGILVQNLEVAVTGSQNADEFVVIGAHYDTAAETPGANDNGSGVAALLALSGECARLRPRRSLRFVAFVNEERPYCYTPLMGSWVYAQRCRENGERVSAMLSLETMGYFADRPHSQRYPAPLSLFYPDVGNFITFVGNLRSRRLVRRAVEVFRGQVRFPAEGAALPSALPGVGWSDQWSFWQAGYPAIMVTDTAPYRYPFYHSDRDTLDKVDIERLARVVEGLGAVVRDLAGAAPGVPGPP